jgi:hypothetical protein
MKLGCTEQIASFGVLEGVSVRRDYFLLNLPLWIVLPLTNGVTVASDIIRA